MCAFTVLQAEILCIIFGSGTASSSGWDRSLRLWDIEFLWVRYAFLVQGHSVSLGEIWVFGTDSDMCAWVMSKMPLRATCFIRSAAGLFSGLTVINNILHVIKHTGAVQNGGRFYANIMKCVIRTLDERIWHIIYHVQVKFPFIV